MKKNKNTGSIGLLLLAGVGLAGVAGFVATRSGGLGLNMPHFLPVPDVVGTAPATSAPADTLGSRYYGPSYTDRYAYLSGGTVVGGASGTSTPTLSSDRSPFAGTSADTPITFGVRVPR